MIVTIMRNKNPKANNVMALLDGYPAWLPLDVKPLTPGTELEVMVTGCFFHKLPGSTYFDYTKLKCLFIRPIDPALDVPVQYEGFETSGSMCSTLSRARIYGRPITISPGRTGVYQADNVNTRYGDGKPRAPIVPGRGWVRELPDKMPRLEGVESYTMLQFFVDRDLASKAAKQPIHT